ncbi:Gfo/Idh/MocA family oxidoreductase [Microbacterium sp. H1-D42]|uniref:Gfo/Idh/MocA family protein n=1 Tax=Microbacterium sp. H1-D42 TaxID=2925844 RepID=UPI001F53D41D|nr:Gfo/Idh/MocA family oxidoreductase [Microbacterium sp. H1-D42]UNK70479.1 Gfo/Idh/MocA family oxidoreductase [Microbacterium sp. H1-D42]
MAHPRADDNGETRDIRLAVVGAGMRGHAYATEAAALPGVEVVAVAEKNPAALSRLRLLFPDARVFDDWQDLAAQPRLADAVIVSLPDHLHRDASVTFAEAGYDILLEKPIATSPEDCDDIENAALANGVSVTVCHVLRYTTYTQKLMQLLDAGAIGEIMQIEHLEPVGHHHFAHSFVRGNWARSATAHSLLLAKSCHDIDWLLHVMGRPVQRVSSFGSLGYFRKESQPAGASDRCVTCPVASSCAFDAARFYRSGLNNPGSSEEYNALVMAGEVTPEAIDRALETGPWGRCVYLCDNDVVDHQTVQMEFTDGRLASFTLTAFAEGSNRKTRLFGTAGQITGDGRMISVYDFRTLKTTVYDTDELGFDAAAGHGGGDRGLMRAFVSALRSSSPASMSSSISASMASHRVVFAAEEARQSGAVVTVAVPAV